MDHRPRPDSIWPLFGLVVRTPRLELRYPSDDDLGALAALTGDIHDLDEMPFIVPWSRVPDGERERNTLQHHWANRAAFEPGAWTLNLVVVVEDEIVGEQAVRATDFPSERTVDTGSWLHRPRQGSGIGTEMRHAVLHLAFAGLGGQRAETSFYAGSDASRRITEKLGYSLTDHGIEEHDAKPTQWWSYAMDRHRWDEGRRDDIELVGLDACRELFGA